MENLVYFIQNTHDRISIVCSVNFLTEKRINLLKNIFKKYLFYKKKIKNLSNRPYKSTNRSDKQINKCNILEGFYGTIAYSCFFSFFTYWNRYDL